MTIAVTAQESLNATVKAAVVDLLYRLGDDGLIIGHRNSEWTGLGPILEEDIAFSSMAQDKMGHALAFYRLLHDLGEPDPDRIAFLREPGEFRCCSLVALECFADDAASGEPPPALCNNPTRDWLVARGDWALGLVRQFFFSEADALRMTALESSAYGPLAQLARKLRGELKYHTLHGRTMMQRLSGATAESRARLQAAVDRLYPHALGVFEPTEHDDALAAGGISPTEAALCEQWRGRIGPMLEGYGFATPANARPVCGGRIGQHPPALAALVTDMQKVYRMDPQTQW